MRLCPLLLPLGALSLPACGSDVATGGATDCSTFLRPDKPAWTPVTLHFTNTHTTPYYLVDDGGCSGDPFSIRDANGKAVASNSGACGLTCAALQTSSCVRAVDCALSPAFYIAPGGSPNVTWQGSIFTENAMPASCSRDAACADICLVEGAPTGKLTFSASLWTAVEGCTPSRCMCDPGATGSGQLDSPATASGMDLQATAPLAAGTDTSVELAF